jgi:hypothetical protein
VEIHAELADKVTSSRAVLIETRRVLRRAERDGRVTAAEADLLAIFAQAASCWAILEFSEEVARRADDGFPSEPVRRLDAIHLASALFLRQSFPDLVILTASTTACARTRSSLASGSLPACERADEAASPIRQCAHHRAGLPVLHPIPFARMPAPLPRRVRWVLSLVSPSGCDLPGPTTRSAPRITLFEVCSECSLAFRPACSPSPPEAAPRPAMKCHSARIPRSLLVATAEHSKVPSWRRSRGCA